MEHIRINLCCFNWSSDSCVFYFQGPPEIKLDENTVLYDQDGQVLSVEHGVKTGLGGAR